MSITFVILAMVFCHIVDDYYLQGWLSSAKQREWWIKNAPQSLYKYDYVVALIMHSMSWSFMIMLPIAIYMDFNVSRPFLIMWLWNVAIHAFVDNLKANRKIINLVCDQTIHIGQIIFTAVCMFNCAL